MSLHTVCAMQLVHYWLNYGMFVAYNRIELSQTCIL